MAKIYYIIIFIIILEMPNFVKSLVLGGLPIKSWAFAQWPTCIHPFEKSVHGLLKRVAKATYVGHIGGCFGKLHGNDEVHVH